MRTAVRRRSRGLVDRSSAEVELIAAVRTGKEYRRSGSDRVGRVAEKFVRQFAAAGRAERSDTFIFSPASGSTKGAGEGSSQDSTRGCREDRSPDHAEKADLHVLREVDDL